MTSSRLPLVILVSLCFATSLPSAFAQRQFLEAPTYLAGNQPRAIATGDFNGDGNPDLVTANHSDDTVNVLLGNPDGTFQHHVAYDVGGFPRSITVADFNGDGALDIAAGDAADNSIGVLLGNGDGTFQRAMLYSVGLDPFSVAAADLNGDGSVDLVSANERDNSVAVLLGNGNGTFQAKKTYAVGSSPYAVAIGDFNNDGKPDLAVANLRRGNPNGSYSILLGNGDGTFQKQKAYTTGGEPLFIVINDLNGDGSLDLMIACFRGGGVAVHLGNGDGTFQPAVSYSTGFRSGPHSIVLGDYNGDGKVDMAVSESGQFTDGATVAILLGNGDGTFQANHLDFGTDQKPLWITAADFNHDGKLDLATANANQETKDVTVLIGNGDGTFRARRDFEMAVGASAVGASSIVTADLNDDGKPDVIASTYSGTAVVLLGNGDGTFQKPHVYTGGSETLGVAVADVNGDNKLDVVSANASTDNVSVFLGNGDGTLQAHMDYPAGDGPDSVAIADFNGDGKLDLAVADEVFGGSGTVSVLLGNGDGSFQQSTPYKVGNDPTSVAVGDLNGDGVIDLAVASASVSTIVNILLGRGDGTFSPSVSYETATSPSSVVIADLNADGKPDLALAVGTGTFGFGASVLLGNGDGTFQPYTFYEILSGADSIVAQDVTGDGKLDLITGNITGGTVSVLQGNGDGTFGSAVDYPVAGSGAGIAVADFNGDHGADIVSANVYSSTVSVLLNTAGTYLNLTSSPNPSTEGQDVTFIVDVSPSLPGSPGATGAITLKDGSNILATLPLRQGLVHYSTSSLSVGMHTITAVYSGDSTYNSNQTSTTQRVNNAPRK